MAGAASRVGPAGPDPQSQSFSRSYGSNLPTSLTYINLSTRGFTPRRPAADWVRSGPSLGIHINSLDRQL